VFKNCGDLAKLIDGSGEQTALCFFGPVSSHNNLSKDRLCFSGAELFHAFVCNDRLMFASFLFALRVYRQFTQL
jgi:hypothetical protein